MARARFQSPQHPAAEAWGQLCPKTVEPNFVEVLQEVPKGTSRSCIYRLAGVGRHRTPVIAKRCMARHAHIEQTIYQEILKNLPVSSLICYGCVDEPETDSSWLFLEDAGGDEFAYSIEEHRRLAARWLAEMHISAASIPAISLLPDRGPKHYLDHLLFTRAIIERHIHNGVLKAQDFQVIEAILLRSCVIASRKRWCTVTLRNTTCGYGKAHVELNSWLSIGKWPVTGSRHPILQSCPVGACPADATIATGRIPSW